MEIYLLHRRIACWRIIGLLDGSEDFFFIYGRTCSRAENDEQHENYISVGEKTTDREKSEKICW
jgi:hypothetical protein